MKDTTYQALTKSLGFTPQRALRVFGMRRSGNHAIINWILRNTPRGSVFLNNCTVGQPAAETWRSVEVNAKRMPIKRGVPVSDVTASVSDGALLVVSYEDFIPDPDDIGAGLTSDVPRDLFSANILLYRSFMNWSASLLRKVQANEGLDSLVCLRVMMAAMDKYREMLEAADLGSQEGRIVINYDHWFARPAYREQVLQSLRLPVIDNTLGQVQPYGGGSSFQKTATTAEDLSAGARWREMVNDPSYQIVLLAAAQDAELVALMKKLMPNDAEMLMAYLDQAQFPYHVEVEE